MAVEVKESEENKGKGQSEEQFNADLTKQLMEMKAQLDELRSQQAEKPAALTTDDAQKAFFEEMLKKLGNINTSSNEAVSNIRRFTNFDDISSDDMLNEKDYVTFMCNRVGHIIVDAIIGNQVVNVPYAPIIFDFKRMDKVRVGKETEIYNTSEYVCKSKKELEFLRKHHLLGVMFYEKSGEVVDVIENKIAVKMVSIMSGLKGVGSNQLFAMCKSLGIAPTDDVASMRQQIALKQAEKLYQAEADKTSSIVKDTILHRKLKQEITK